MGRILENRIYRMLGWSILKIFTIATYSTLSAVLLLLYFGYFDKNISLYLIPFSVLLYIIIGIYYMNSRIYKVKLIFSKEFRKAEDFFTTAMRAFLFPTVLVFFKESGYYYSIGGVAAAVFFLSMAALIIYHVYHVIRFLEW